MVVNKVADPASAVLAKIVAFCEEASLEILGMIPYDPSVIENLNRGKTAIASDSPAGNAIRAMAEVLRQRIDF